MMNKNKKDYAALIALAEREMNEMTKVVTEGHHKVRLTATYNSKDIFDREGYFYDIRMKDGAEQVVVVLKAVFENGADCTRKCNQIAIWPDYLEYQRDKMADAYGYDRTMSLAQILSDIAKSGKPIDVWTHVVKNGPYTNVYAYWTEKDYVEANQRKMRKDFEGDIEARIKARLESKKEAESYFD